MAHGEHKEMICSEVNSDTSDETTTNNNMIGVRGCQFIVHSTSGWRYPERRSIGFP